VVKGGTINPYFFLLIPKKKSQKCDRGVRARGGRGGGVLKEVKITPYYNPSCLYYLNIVHTQQFILIHHVQATVHIYISFHILGM
jgi:hypothetical protein